MNRSLTARQPGRHLLGGALRSLVAESLFPATALVTTAFLTRRLGPQGYGFLVLTATLVTWAEWTLNAFFARPAVKLISEAEDWKSVSDALVQQQFLASLAVTLLLWLLAAPIAALLNEPGLTWYLVLFAVDVPLFNLAQAHKNVLIGRGDFTHSANLSAVRWISRLLLIVALVGGGLSVGGAILGTIGASLAEVLVARRYVRPSLFGIPKLVSVWALGMPLFVSSLFLGFYTRLDVFALKRLGATTDEAGIYGAAQSLALLPSIFTLAFMPLLLSTLSRLLARSEEDAAKEIAVNALRGVVGLMPIAAIVAGSAEEIVSVFFGRPFESGGRALAVLVVGSFALMVVPVASAILIALGKAARTPSLTVPLVPLALVGHVLVIPRYGTMGAAVVTTGVALIGTSWALWCIHDVWRVLPPRATIVRSLLVSAVAFAAAAMWPTPGLLVLLKLPVLALGCLFLFVGFGEFTSDDLAMTGSLLTRQRP